MASAVQTQVSKVAVLAALVKDTSPVGPWDGATCQLFTNDQDPSPQDVAGDYDEPTWTGYADQDVTWNTPYASGANAGELVGDSCFFLSGADSAETVYGFIVKKADGSLLWAQRASTPIAVSGVSGITVVPLFQLL